MHMQQKEAHRAKTVDTPTCRMIAARAPSGHTVSLQAQVNVRPRLYNNCAAKANDRSPTRAQNAGINIAEGALK